MEKRIHNTVYVNNHFFEFFTTEKTNEKPYDIKVYLNTEYFITISSEQIEDFIIYVQKLMDFAL